VNARLDRSGDDGVEDGSLGEIIAETNKRLASAETADGPQASNARQNDRAAAQSGANGICRTSERSVDIFLDRRICWVCRYRRGASDERWKKIVPRKKSAGIFYEISRQVAYAESMRRVLLRGLREKLRSGEQANDADP
jgi:hypothetical protein